MPKQPSPVLHKTIFEVRYAPELRFYESLIPAARLMSEYKHWETDRLAVTLRDYGEHCSLTIRYTVFAYEQNSGKEDLEKERIDNCLGQLPSALGVVSLTRLGYRRQYLVPVNLPFESLVSVMNVKLFAQDEELRRVMPTQVHDLMYRIDSSEADCKYHFTLGPVRKEEIPQWLTYNTRNHLEPATADDKYREIRESYPAVAVFVDIDMYREAQDLPISDAPAFVDASRARLETLAGGLTHYLFSQELEG